ncbi:MAG TPA: biotin/lipoate A/B protein ligase family protein [Bacillales bacterium]|nr:biotin/lipoate A/B protein ligase family protein [Bacillales bacterium]
MKETWYYLDSGERSPAYNMALDEALLNWHSRKLIPPTLRFYTWNPSTLSIGYFQKKDKINLEGVRRHGLGFVRRLTGGRAVFHDQELTYSVVVSEDHPEMPKTVTEAYRVISRGVLEGFRELGLDAYFSIPDKQVKQEVQSAVCFDEPSWYELVVGGRKAAGSAQTRQKGVILQHGAIPLDVDEDKLFDLFVYPNREARMRAQEGFGSKACAINLLRDEPVSVDEAKDAFKSGFEKGLNVELESFKLSEEQEAEVREIAEERYGSDEWTYLR